MGLEHIEGLPGLDDLGPITAGKLWLTFHKLEHDNVPIGPYVCKARYEDAKDEWSKWPTSKCPVVDSAPRRNALPDGSH